MHPLHTLSKIRVYLCRNNVSRFMLWLVAPKNALKLAVRLALSFRTVVPIWLTLD